MDNWQSVVDRDCVLNLGGALLNCPRPRPVQIEQCLALCLGFAPACTSVRVSRGAFGVGVFAGH